ncbi:GntR family transcriptional regulator, partial [Bradyrhizobium sp. LHD-71]|uniref:GntR family transcriptional regulator n=1 Tax=Bradyrhizobium sp. LHD-71 TaxID=3072141 RepID=UPI00280D1462
GGSVLPSEFELTEAFNVSRITAKRALDELATEGLVERVRGRGTTVTDRAASLLDARPITASIDGLRENLTAIGRETSVEVIEFGYVPATGVVRARLELEPNTRTQRAVRVRSLDGEPLSQSTTYVPERIGRAYGAKDLASTPIIDLIERAGVVVGAAEQSISATLADSLVASRLKVSVGAPLLLMKRCVKDTSGKPAQYIEILYRPDRFEYRMSLTREQAAGHGRFATAEAKDNSGSKTKPPRKRTGTTKGGGGR